MSAERLALIRKELRNYSWKVHGDVWADEFEPGLYEFGVEEPVYDSDTRRMKCESKRWFHTSMLLPDSVLFPNGRLRRRVLKEHLKDCAHLAGLHESEEWLRYKGKTVMNPHPR
jgi:hypothetical protein